MVAHGLVAGALFQFRNFTPVAGGLFLVTGFLHHRTGSIELSRLDDDARSMPLLACFFLLLGLAARCPPGTSGFPAERLLIRSALDSHIRAGLAARFGVIFGAGYLLSIYRQAFLAPTRNNLVAAAQDLRRRELPVPVVRALVVRLLMLLQARDELCVCQLTAALGLPQPKISRHLAILRETEMLLDRRMGTWIFYQIHPNLPAWARDALAAVARGCAGTYPFAQDWQRLANLASGSAGTCN